MGTIATGTNAIY